MYKLFFKRFLDVLLAAIGLLVLSPIILILAILTKIFLGSVIFKQERTGKGGKIFYIYKFKTMKDLRDENGVLLPNELRRSKFGGFLRSTSLDELPELWNIFVGDMSIIGPRPLHASYMPYYKDEEKSRNTVRGGIIPPEVLIDNLTPTWDEQLHAEADYASRVSLWLDIKVLFCVFRTLFRRLKNSYGEYNRPALDVERAELFKVTNTQSEDVNV